MSSTKTILGRIAYYRKKRRRYSRVRSFINEIKSVPCKDCGASFAPHIMHFDHRNPLEKSMEIGTSKMGSRKRLLEEISKCDVVCANCHANRTYNGKHWAIRRPIAAEVDKGQLELSLA